MTARLSEDEIQSLKSLLVELDKDVSKLDGEVGAATISLLEASRKRAFSDHPAVDAILSQPRTPPAMGIAFDPRFAGGYSDTGYNDVQDPQPGGGYKDYSQWIDSSISPVAGGYHDVQDPQPGGGYKDYSEWIEDDRVTNGWYNDGPWDEYSVTLRDNILTNPDLVRELQNRNLLSEAMASIVKGE